MFCSRCGEVTPRQDADWLICPHCHGWLADVTMPAVTVEAKQMDDEAANMADVITRLQRGECITPEWIIKQRYRKYMSGALRMLDAAREAIRKEQT